MDIFEYLKRIVHDLAGTPIEDIHPESTKEELKLDPFDVEELKLDVEKEFDVLIPEDDFNTLEDLVKMVDAA